MGITYKDLRRENIHKNMYLLPSTWQTLADLSVEWIDTDSREK